MLRKPLLCLFLALVLGGTFSIGVARLFSLRFATGDIYPAYSSLRSDPLGTKALADALDELPKVEVRRNFQPLTKLRDGGPVTLVYTGIPHRAFWTEQEIAAFDALMVQGSRAVFTFFPVDRSQSQIQEKHAKDEERAKKKEKSEEERAGSKKKKDDGKKKKKKDKKESESKDDESDDLEKYFVDFDAAAKRWGFSFGYLPEEKKAFDRHAACVEAGGNLETDLTWHSALYFRDLKPQWKVLYVCGTMPVVVERSYGSGSIILVADSFFISNEGLRNERHSRLLARLFSGPPTVVFDEESHDLRDSPGVASLIRKYRLHGVVAGIVLLALCFVWKNAIRFIPTYQPEFAESDVIAGKESGEGFINLLRRSIGRAAIFETCVAEWRKAFAHQPRELARVEEVLAAEQARPARERDPIAAYRAIRRALAGKFKI